MSFDIPGYYLDKKRNKLFKLNPTGPYSLGEIRKRLKAEEEEEAEALRKKKKQLHQKPIPNINQFIQQRARFGNPIRAATTHPGLVSLMAHLKPRHALRLDGSKETYHTIKVDVDQDEFIMANKKGIGRFGYQSDPQFMVWASGFIGDYHHFGNVTSLHYKRQQQQQRTMVVNGTANHPQAGGVFFEYAIKQQPPLTQDEIDTMSSIRNNDTILGIPNSHLENMDSIPLYEYRMKKDTFWSSSFDAFHGTTVIGGEKKIHIIDSGFERAYSRYMNSDVFSLHIPTTQRQICWVGLRNGTVGSIDLRASSKQQHHQQQQKAKFNFKLKESSSITNIRCLDHGSTGNEVLVTCLDGTISIWDKRKPQKNPVRRLTGHRNETQHNVGFDLDERNNMVMMAGDDGYVRIWCLFRTTSDPIWTSEKYTRPVPAVAFLNNDCLGSSSASSLSSSFYHGRSKLPGVALFGTCRENKPFAEIEYFSSL